MATMLLEIITAERIVYSDEVDVVVAPGVEGELGILPYHASLMTMLQPGELIIRKGGQENYLAVTGGFLEVMNNKVTVLADAAERSEEINEERAQAAMKAAQERLAQRGADVDLEQAMAAVRRAQVRLNVARRRTRGGQAGPGERRT
jgi:F-type H+-transporting ATPase subunit epsilon